MYYYLTAYDDVMILITVECLCTDGILGNNAIMVIMVIIMIIIII